MKRIKVLLILVFCLVVSLAAAACGNATSASEKPAESSGAGSESTSKPTSESTSVSCSHNFVEVSEEAPTCEKAGVKHFECSICRETKTESFGKALGHDFGEWEVVNAATCTEAGLKSRECRRENCEKYETEEIKPSHNYTLDEEQSVAPTCEEAGKKVFVCVCGESYENAVPPLGHLKDESVAPVITAPTCEEAGYTVYHCNRAGCGKDYRADEVKALGHNHEAKTPVAASCKTGGYTEYKCSRCDDSYRTYSSSKLAHAFDNDGVCETCGEDYLEAVAVDSSSENNKSYAVKDEKYGYVVYLEDDGSTIARITLDKAVIEQLVANRYYNVTVKFGCPDRSYRSFGWRFGKTEESDGIFSAGNCFSLEGFNDTCLFKLVLGDENGVGEKFKYTYVENDATKTVELPYSENGIEFEVWYTYFGDEKVSPETVTEDRKSNPLAYNGTLNDFAMKLELAQSPKPFNPEDLTTYFETDAKIVVDGKTVIVTAAAGTKLKLKPEAVAYWLDNGYGDANFVFTSKEGQATTFDVIVDGTKPVPAAHKILSIERYKLTEAMRTNGIVLQPYYGNFVDGEEHADSDGYVLQISANEAFDANDKNTWLYTGYEIVYNEDAGNWSVTGNKYDDTRNFEIKAETLAYLKSQGCISISFTLSYAEGEKVIYRVDGKYYSTGNLKNYLSGEIALTDEVCANGLTYSINYHDLNHANPDWKGTKDVEGFTFTLDMAKSFEVDKKYWITKYVTTTFTATTWNSEAGYLQVSDNGVSNDVTLNKAVTINGEFFKAMRNQGYTSFVISLKPKTNQSPKNLGILYNGAWKWGNGGDAVLDEIAITDEIVGKNFSFNALYQGGTEIVDGLFFDIELKKAN